MNSKRRKCRKTQQSDKNRIKKLSEKQIKLRKTLPKNPKDISSITVLKGKKASDSISNLKNLVNKIIISMVRDSIEFNKLSKALEKELLRKNISLKHIVSDKIVKSQEIVMAELTKGKGTIDLFGNETDFTSRKSY